VIAVLVYVTCVVAAFVYLVFGRAPGPVGELHGHDKTVFALSFVSGDEALVSGSMDHTVRVWDMPAGTCRQVIRTPGVSPCVASCATEPWFVSSAAGGECRLWEASDTEPWAWHLTGGESVRRVAVSPSGKFLAASTSEFSVHVWQTGQQRPVLSLGVESGYPCGNALVFVGDNVLACQSSKAGVTLVDVEARKVLAQLGDHVGRCEALACVDEATLVTGGYIRRSKLESDPYIRVWSVPGRRCERALVLPDGVGVVSLAVAARHGVVVAGCTDGSLVVCDLRTLRVVRRVSAHDGWVYALAVSSDDRLLASGGFTREEQGIIRLWDVDQLAKGAGPK
jgi:WD40 repeat protein